MKSRPRVLRVERAGSWGHADDGRRTQGTVQPTGKKAMAAADWARGLHGDPLVFVPGQSCRRAAYDVLHEVGAQGRMPT